MLADVDRLSHSIDLLFYPHNSSCQITNNRQITNNNNDNQYRINPPNNYDDVYAADDDYAENQDSPRTYRSDDYDDNSFHSFERSDDDDDDDGFDAPSDLSGINLNLESTDYSSDYVPGQFPSTDESEMFQQNIPNSTEMFQQNIPQYKEALSSLNLDKKRTN